MENNEKYVLYYYENYEGPYFLGYVDTEEEAKKFKDNNKLILNRDNETPYIHYDKINKLDISMLENKALGFEFKFKIGLNNDEEFKMMPIRYEQYSYNINDKNDKEGLSYEKNHIFIKIHNSDEIVSLSRAKFYYRELVKDIIINNHNVYDAIKEINKKISERNI